MAARPPATERSRRASERGFTLMELLITLAIATVGMVGVMSLHLSVGRGNEGAARSNEALSVASETVEWLRSMTFPEVVTELGAQPVFGAPLTVDLPAVIGRAAMTFRRRTIATVLSGNQAAQNRLTRFRVEVSWTEDGAVRTAADNFSGGRFDHSVSFEFVRTEKENL